MLIIRSVRDISTNITVFWKIRTSLQFHAIYRLGPEKHHVRIKRMPHNGILVDQFRLNATRANEYYCWQQNSVLYIPTTRYIMKSLISVPPNRLCTLERNSLSGLSTARRWLFCLLNKRDNHALILSGEAALVMWRKWPNHPNLQPGE